MVKSVLTPFRSLLFELMLYVKKGTQALMMAKNRETRITVLGTLAEFHDEAIPFNMSSLLELVANVNPDFLCLDITPQQWLSRDFAELPPEYREALLPLASQTDIVVAPIGLEANSLSLEIAGWRLETINRIRRRISAVQRGAPSPQAMNQGWRHELVNILYYVIRRLTASDRRRSTRAHADRLTEQVLELTRRDPGVRLMVVVNVQYCHLIRDRLRKYDEVVVTDFSDL